MDLCLLSLRNIIQLQINQPCIILFEYVKLNFLILTRQRLSTLNFCHILTSGLMSLTSTSYRTSFMTVLLSGIVDQSIVSNSLLYCYRRSLITQQWIVFRTCGLALILNRIAILRCECCRITRNSGYQLTQRLQGAFSPPWSNLKVNGRCTNCETKQE